MNTFDNKEKTIHEAFSKINVDGSKLTEQIKSRLHEESEIILEPYKRRWSTSVVAALAIMIIMTATAAAATLGGFDWFMQKFNPPFSQVVEPVGISAEDQGIRMEVIGAQKYGNKAIVYLSIRDVSGQNRLSEQTAFQDGFTVTMDAASKNGHQTEKISGFSCRENMLFFDEETNTLYYEFNITADGDSPLSDPLELGTYRIYFDKKEYEGFVPVDFGSLKNTEIIQVTEDHVWGATNLPEGMSGTSDILTKGKYNVLIPGKYASMTPEEDIWISNIGIVDGKLHVQIGKEFGKEFGSNDPSIALIAADGENIMPDYELDLFADKDNKLLDDFDTIGYSGASNKYTEAVFSVDINDLDAYRLAFSSSYYSGAEGKWKIAAGLSDTSRQMRIWSDNVTIEGHSFEYFTLSPLGIVIHGSYETEECITSVMTVELETSQGIIPLRGGGGSRDEQAKTFSSHWETESSLDVTTITALIINGTRVPVK